MTLVQWLAVVSTALLGALAIFQILLAAGLPLGRLAWGGRYRVLPPGLRLGSVLAIPLLAVAGWAVLARVGLAAPGAGAAWVRVFVWVFALYLCLNTAANLASKSPLERKVMTPVSAFLAVCYFAAAVS